MSATSSRRPHSRTRYRGRTSSITPGAADIRASPLDPWAYDPSHGPHGENEDEVNVILTSPHGKAQTRSTQPDTSLSLVPAATKTSKLTRGPSQISVVEVEASPPSPHVMTRSQEASAASWRLRSTGPQTDGNERVAPTPESPVKTATLHEHFTADPPRRASIPVPLASYPRASVPSLPFSNLPDLNKIEAIRPALVAEQLMLSEPCQLPETKAFTLASPPYTDAEIPAPEPYNDAFPHPLTSYASPGVNANTVMLSGYDVELAKLMKTDRAKALGTILATCDRPGITAPTLAKHLRSYIPDGNGIPGFDNEGAAKAALGPVGAAICRSDDRLNELTGGGGSGIQPVFTPALNHVPPRLAAQARAESRNREAHLSMSSISDHGYRPITPPISPGLLPDHTAIQIHGADDYFGGLYRRASTASDISQAGVGHYLQQPVAHLRPESYALVNPGPENHQKPSPSTYHKTELCPAWQEQGQCKYGNACQFAHGLAELRLPLARTPFAFPDMPSPQPQLQPQQSPTHASLAHYKPDLRRASAPYSHLDTVHEAEDDYPFPVFTPGRRASEAVGELSPASLAFRRSSIARLSIPRHHVESGREVSPSGYPSDALAPPRTPTQTAMSGSFSSAALATPSDRPSPSAGGYLHTRASDSSLATSGYSPSPKAPYLRSDESTPTRLDPAPAPMPINTASITNRRSVAVPTSPADAASSGSWGSNHKSSSNSTNATVDFSAGRSIWC